MRHWEAKQKKNFVSNSNNTKAELSQFLASRILLVILSIVLIAVLSAFTRDFSQKSNVDSEVVDLQSRISELEKERDDYLSMINYYSSDEYLKQQAKRNLELKDAGENIVVISDDELEKYLLLEAELENLKNFKNNVIEDSVEENENEIVDDELKIQKQFRIWWEYIF